MGIAKGRFVIDTHVHAQRAALKWKERGLTPNWVSLGELRAESQAYDNSPRLLYDMERYGVDMCVLNPYLEPHIDVEHPLLDRDLRSFTVISLGSLSSAARCVKRALRRAGRSAPLPVCVVSDRCGRTRATRRRKDPHR